MKSRHCRIVAIEHLTLDGVYQAPARMDEDSRNGFAHGGWSIAGNHPELQQHIGRYMQGGWSLLAGRTTYEDLYEGWVVRQPSSGMTMALTNTQKFVVSHDAGYRPAWGNSTLVSGDVEKHIGALRQAYDKTLIIFGSGVLVRTLLHAGLIDEFLLMIHPLVLGEGYQLFTSEASAAKLTLADHAATATGVLIARYRIASV